MEHIPDLSDYSGIAQRNRKGALAVNIGLAANVLLAGLKTTLGVIGHSPALLADGINSVSDVAYYLVVWVFLRMSRKPADEMHPYGHSQIESIASLVVGAFVISTAIAIFWESINNIFDLWVGNSELQPAASYTLWIALFTIIVKVILMVYTRRLGMQTNNPAVLALAFDHRNDIISASAVAIGIFLGLRGYLWVDPAVGALVAVVILRTGIEILRQSSAELMDAVPSQELTRQIVGLLAIIPEIETVEEVHAHRFGPYMVVNVTIGVDGAMSVAEGDCIATHVENLLAEKVDLLQKVYVHYHPVVQLKTCKPGEVSVLAHPSEKAVKPAA